MHPQYWSSNKLIIYLYYWGQCMKDCGFFTTLYGWVFPSQVWRLLSRNLYCCCLCFPFGYIKGLNSQRIQSLEQYNCLEFYLYFLVCSRGKGDYFRLGHGTDVHVRKPQVVEGLRGKKIVHVAVGALHCLAVTDTGQVCYSGPERVRILKQCNVVTAVILNGINSLNYILFYFSKHCTNINVIVT